MTPQTKLAFFGALVATPAAVQGSPVEKVVNLMKKLHTRIAQDGENEQKVYDKYACWCDTTMKRKADAIDQARGDLRGLQQQILTLKGEIATLGSEIAEHQAAITENEKLMSDATAQRQQENGDYSSSTAEMKQTLAALQDAINALIKGQGGSALVQETIGATASAAVRNVLSMLPVTASVSDEQISALQDFQKAAASGTYAPQSMTIIGMLKNLYDSTSSDLESTTLTEATNNRDYELFTHEKQTENVNLLAAKTLREENKADAEASLAAATSLYDETDAQMAADTDFFDITKEGCLEKSAEWNVRKSLRASEMDGISKAIEILTSDEARELFASAIKPGKSALVQTGAVGMSFLQVEEARAGRAVAKAYATLKKQAAKSHSLALAQLAIQVQATKTGHFEAVIQAIDNMVVALKEEGQADIDKRDQCKQEYLSTESTIKQLTWEIEKNQAKIDKIDSVIEKHEAEKAATIQSISDTNTQIAEMVAQRTADNQAFLNKKQEDEQAIALLDSAKDVLTKFYKEQGIEMVQLHQPAFEVSEDQAPDAKLSGGGSRSGESKGIVSLMDYIIEDLHGEVKTGIKDEATAQLNFEAAKKAAEQLVADLTAKKVSLEEAIAKQQEEKAAENAIMENNQALLNDETTYRQQITPDCDWIIGAFTKRSQRRTAEMNGLTTAKEFLQGATLVQTKERGGLIR